MSSPGAAAARRRRTPNSTTHVPVALPSGRTVAASQWFLAGEARCAGPGRSSRETAETSKEVNDAKQSRK
jgi:hypothetical protein